ncbi:MAG TPA: nuclease-related domain-containing protein, partial [Actinomycetales bacterium]|nr:nuclease-related domain-containing protein [Actinomycetales bacterium]
EQQLYAWQRGLDGERRTGEVLSALERQGWVVLHDLHWPGRPFANIDHIAIGPGGVFVIDSKNWTGEVAVRDGVLRQNGHRRIDECEGAAASTAGVAAFLEPQHRSLVTAVLCLVDQPTPTMQPPQVCVVGLDDLEHHLVASALCLNDREIGRIGDYLRQLLGGPKSPPMKTTAALAAAGTAPPEPRRPMARRHRPPGYRTRSRRPGRTRPRLRTSTGSALLPMVKVGLVLFFALVVLPRWIPLLTDGLTADTPSVTTPPTVTRSTPAVPSRTPKLSTQKPRTTSPTSHR